MMGRLDRDQGQFLYCIRSMRSSRTSDQDRRVLSLPDDTRISKHKGCALVACSDFFPVRGVSADFEFERH